MAVAKTLTSIQTAYKRYIAAKKAAGEKTGIAGVFPIYVISVITGINKPSSSE
jgi:hypothetical protein